MPYTPPNTIIISFRGTEFSTGAITISLVALDGEKTLDATDILIKKSLENYLGGSEEEESSGTTFNKQASLTELIRNPKYIEFCKKYSRNTIAFNITTYTDKTDNYKASVWNQLKTDIRFEDNFSLDGIRIDKGYELPELSYDITTINEYKTSFKELEVQYLAAKAKYETEVKDAGLTVFEQNESYEPSDGTYIITRMLEFQLGTLVPAIRHFKTTQNNPALRQATLIDMSINNLSKLFPDITIDDGEGMPYQ